MFFKNYLIQVHSLRKEGRKKRREGGGKEGGKKEAGMERN
jgi:hypothetical protein